MMAVQHTTAGLLGLVLAAASALYLWGFTVDDALISARYATNIARGDGHVFSPGTPISDGVTPLAWPYLLAPFARGGPSDALIAGKLIGLIAWLISAPALALHIATIVGQRLCLGHLAFIVAFATPAVAAWSVSGMEIGLALGLVCLSTMAGATKKFRAFAPLGLGIASAFRPELLPFSLTLSVGCAFVSTRKSPSSQRILDVGKFSALALLPFAITCLVRIVVFGSASPLALRAKPPNLQHGLIYATATLLIAGPPLAVLAPLAYRKLRAWPRWLLVAFIVHCLTCVAVGGDWMPMSRLFVPVLPILGIVFAHLSLQAAPWSNALRTALCLASQAFVLVSVGASARGVQADRDRLIEALQHQLRTEDVIASVDIGWVGTAHSGIVVDLAGVTDPHVAALAGGHTSKRVPAGFFDVRNVSHLIMLLPKSSQTSTFKVWEKCLFSRRVEVRICRMMQDRFVIMSEVESTPSLRYVLLKRR